MARPRAPAGARAAVGDGQPGPMTDRPTDPRAAGGGARPRADRALDGAVVAFALWTIAANTTVLSGRGLDHAIGAFALLALIAIVVARVTRAAAVGGPRPAPAEPERAPRSRWVVLAVCGAVALAGGGWLADPVGRWWLAVALGAIGLASALATGPGSTGSTGEEGGRAPSRADGPTGGRLAALALLAAVAALGALGAHRPDSDDGFYLNLAVAAADAPTAPLFARDTLHGLGAAPAWIAIYSVQSFELALAAIARWTGLEPLVVAHAIAPALGALLLPFALARAFRALGSRAWLTATVAALVFLAAAGEAANPYGEFALLRLQQGKSWFAVAGVALCVAYALELARAPGRGALVRLAAVQVACVGFTSGALWMAPVVVGLTLVGALARDPSDGATLGPAERLRRLGLGLATALGPVGLALAIRARLQDAVASFTDQFDEGDHFVEAWDRVLGADPLRLVAVAAALAVPYVAASARARRVGAVFVLGFLVLFWNPYLDTWLARTLTGLPTYWRVFWLLPLPLLCGLLLASPCELGTRPGARRLGAALGALAIAAVGVLGVARGTAVHQADAIRFGPPGVHVDPEELAVARALRDATVAGAAVLAPRSITRWIVALRDHPLPLVSRLFYLEPLRATIGDAAVDRRLDLWRLTENGPFAAGELARGVQEFDLAALAVRIRPDGPGPSVPRPALTAMRRTFRAVGLRRVELPELSGEPRYEVWAR